MKILPTQTSQLGYTFIYFIGDHPFCLKEVGRAGGVYFFFLTGMNVVVCSSM